MPQWNALQVLCIQARKEKAQSYPRQRPNGGAQLVVLLYAKKRRSKYPRLPEAKVPQTTVKEARATAVTALNGLEP